MTAVQQIVNGGNRLDISYTQGLYCFGFNRLVPRHLKGIQTFDTAETYVAPFLEWYLDTLVA